MPLVSVIIPVFNAENTLKECLQSVLDQSLKDIEIICVDDCSTDNSVRIINNFSLLDTRVKLIRQFNNLGPGSARNEGIKNSKGSYVAFLDSDDLFAPFALKLLYDKALLSKAEMVGGNLWLRHSDNTITVPRPFPFLFNEEGILRADEHPSLWFPWHHCRYLYLKSFLLENNVSYLSGGRIGEDSYMAAKALCSAKTIYACPHPIYYQGRDINMSYQYKYRPHWIEYLRTTALIYNIFLDGGLKKHAYLYINHGFHGLFNKENWNSFPADKLEVAKKILFELFSNFDLDYYKNVDLSPYDKNIKHVLPNIESVRQNDFNKLISILKGSTAVPTPHTNHLSGKLHSIYNSTSWKITRPLRRAKGFYKKIRKRISNFLIIRAS